VLSFYRYIEKSANVRTAESIANDYNNIVIIIIGRDGAGHAAENFNSNFFKLF